MKFVFFGTPEFAATVLEKLIAAGYVPAAIVCNPDKQVGRKQVLTPPPTKILAGKYGINILQPEILANYELPIANYEPDLAIIAAYGKIIPKTILDIPKHGFINIHASLLPKYRGASPIQYAILNGDKETGITIMKVDEEMDHGPLLGKSEIRISKFETYENLSQKLAILGAKLLTKIIPDYIDGKIKLVEQDHSKATFAKIIKKEDGKIDWSKSAEEIEMMTRAYYPWPTAYTYLKSQNSNLKTTDKNLKLLKIFEADIVNGGDKKIGEVFLKNNELAVQCGENILIIKKLQLEGGKILSAKEFLNGRKDFTRSILQ